MLRDLVKEKPVPRSLHEFMRVRLSQEFFDLKNGFRDRARDIFRFAWWNRGYNNGDVEYGNLFAEYSKYPRSYHNMGHIYDLLSTLYILEPNIKADAFAQSADYEAIIDELILLIFFHDVIYIPGNKDNEEQSSYYFSGVARPTIFTLIPEHIRATKEHRDLNVNYFIPGGDVNRARNELFLRKLLFDLDLSSLGVYPPLFKEYRQKVEEEYPGVPKELIQQGTKEFFKKFIQDRPRIYQTRVFYDIFEEQAQINIRSLIDASQ